MEQVHPGVCEIGRLRLMRSITPPWRESTMTDGFPHKWSVIQKAFPCHNVINSSLVQVMPWCQTGDKSFSWTHWGQFVDIPQGGLNGLKKNEVACEWTCRHRKKSPWKNRKENSSSKGLNVTVPKKCYWLFLFLVRPIPRISWKFVHAFSRIGAKRHTANQTDRQINRPTNQPINQPTMTKT